MRAPRLSLHMRLRNKIPAEVPEHIDLGLADGVALRRARPFYAKAIVQCVTESRAHLRPWMPWAGDDNTFDIEWQRDRLSNRLIAWEDGEEFQFVLVDRHDTRVLGSCGLMSRRGPGTLEIGYWTHVEVGGRGYGRAAARALTDVACGIDGVERIYICCDQANDRSAAIPRALGYTLEAIVDREPTAPGESGRDMVWVLAK